MVEAAPKPSIAVVIPTLGRPTVLADTLASIARQTLKATQVIVSATSHEDLPVSIPWGVETIVGATGSCVQRNAAKAKLRSDVDFVVLLDDDVELAPDYLEAVVEVMQKNPSIALLGGSVLAEGVARQEAICILACEKRHDKERLANYCRALYGCSMSARAGVFRIVDFDENLRLMGWLEDFDWCVRAGRYGKIAHCPGAHLVHLKTPSGRGSDRKFGYAQVINPYYLYRKGSIPRFREVLERHWCRCLASNLAGFLRRDARIDRWGRLMGNIRGFEDVVCGRVEPQRIELV